MVREPSPFESIDRSERRRLTARNAKQSADAKLSVSSGMLGRCSVSSSDLTHQQIPKSRPEVE